MTEKNRVLALAAVLILLLGACQAADFEPPRLATATARAELAAAPTPTLLVSEAPTATPAPPTAELEGEPDIAPGENNPTLTLWVDETSAEHQRLLDSLAADFTRASGIQLEVIMVAPRLMPELMDTAVVSNSLPDLVLHPLEYTAGWAEQGILDSAAATTSLERLGEETFSQAALELVRPDSAAQSVIALPSDGWQQLIIYRQDWFTDRGLAPPNSFDSLLAAAETIFEPETVVSGLVIPTDRSLVSTQQAFEFMALANGCQLIDANGEVSLLHPACLETLDFYRILINGYSPIGIQTNTSAVNAYLAGRTGIIMASPAVLPQIAGLDPNFRPRCPACQTESYLAENSGFITRLQGSGEFAAPANFVTGRNLGITIQADSTAAQAFVDFWYNEAYLQWLALNPERKIPWRLGTAENPSLYRDQWPDLPLIPDQPTLSQFFGPELAGLLSDETNNTRRWAISQSQGALLSRLYEELIISPLLQEMLSGYFTSSQTIVEMNQAALELLPPNPNSPAPE